MRERFAHRIRHPGVFLSIAIVGGWVFGFGGCATQEIAPQPPPPAEVPRYVQVTHPAGFDLADIRAIFFDKSAPPHDSLRECEADFVKLRSLTQSLDEQRDGALELVKRDPVSYHWCFYSKIIALEDTLKTEAFFDVRQKKVLEAYAFLVPVARAFMTQYHDSRYLRWAIKHYRKVSEWVFFRRLDLSPQATSELVDVSNVFGNWRQPSSSQSMVLEKYGIITKTAEFSAPSGSSGSPGSPEPAASPAPTTPLPELPPPLLMEEAESVNSSGGSAAPAAADAAPAALREPAASQPLTQGPPLSASASATEAPPTAPSHAPSPVPPPAPVMSASPAPAADSAPASHPAATPSPGQDTSR